MRFFLYLCICFLPISLNAQVQIAGKITDNRGKPLAGASISLKDTYDGATTDSLGNFSFTSTEKGDHILEVTLIGYSTYTKSIILNKNITLFIQLKELITELNAITLTAGAFEASDKKKGAVLSALDIVTTASAEGDITGALKSLPGTQQVGEEGGLFVRGGTATESKIYIDGNLVNNFFYSSIPGIASRGRFNPFLFKGTIFSSGGYSALYGQALSSALILETTDLPDKTQASLGFSVIGLNSGIQKLAKNKKSSWGITYNFSHLGLAFAVIKQKQDYFKTPVYHEGDANFRIKTKNGGMIKYFGYWSTGKLGFRTHDIDSATLNDAFRLQDLNSYQNFTWKMNAGNGWKITPGISFSTDKQNISNELQDKNDIPQSFTNPAGYDFKNFQVHTHNYYGQARILIEKKLKGMNSLRWGSDYFITHENVNYSALDSTSFEQAIHEKLYAAFAETDFYLSPRLALKVGSRAEHSALLKKWNWAPRFSLAYRLKNNSQASFAYGIFYQTPESQYLPATPGIGYAQATHYILQYQRTTTGKTFRTEVFYKKYNHLYKTAATPFQTSYADNNMGSGYAQGVELFWRDKTTIKNLDYWISYSYLDTKRNFLNFPYSMQPNFAANHTASFIVKKFFLPWKTGLNLSYNFASGRPYYHLKYDYNQQKNIIEDAGTTIPYHNMGLAVNYLPNLGKSNKKAFVVWVLSVSNVLGQNQVFTYKYGNINNNKEAVGPTSKRFVFIGCFLSFGVDRTEDAINNHL